MRVGSRGHDIEASSPQEFCDKLHALSIKEIQLSIDKSFPIYTSSKEKIKELADTLLKNDIHVAVFSCYIDPLTASGQEKFLQYMEYVSMFNADVIATETATTVSSEFETEENYEKLLSVARIFAKKAEELNIGFAFEPVKNMPLYSCETTLRLLGDVGSQNMKIVFDPANLIDETNIVRQNDIFSDMISLVGKSISTLHFKSAPDIEYELPLDFVKNNPSVTVITEGICDEELVKALGFLRGALKP